MKIELLRSRILRFTALASLCLALASCDGERHCCNTCASTSAASATQSAPSVATSPAMAETPVKTPDEALARLMEGNRRFVALNAQHPNASEARRMELTKGQKPFATIFSCVDSRVPPEIVFDRGLGDLFVARTAGQVPDRAVMGSLEYGVDHVHIPLLMVLGHRKCGAVTATMETLEHNGHAPGDIAALVEAIKPAVEKTKGQSEQLDKAIRANVELTVERIKRSPIVSEALKKGELKIVGAVYDLDTGKVEITAQ